MENEKSFFNRLINWFTSKKEIKESSGEREDDYLAGKVQEAKRAAALTTNRINYGSQSYLIIEADQTFYGNTEHPDLNSISLWFTIWTGKNYTTLYLTCYLPLSQEEVVPGIYPFDENYSSMSMDGSLHFFGEKDGESYDEDIHIIAGSLEVKKEGESYLITGDFRTGNNKTLTIHYQGGFRFRKLVAPPNGQGGFRYEGKTYIFDTLFENNQGIQSDFILEERGIHVGYWRNQREIQLVAEDIMEDTQYKIFFKVGMKDGDRLLPGEYACSEEKYHPTAGTFIGSIMLAKEDDEEYTVFRITSGILSVERDEYLVFKGGFTLENGKPLVLTYTGKPQWNDYS